MAGLRPLTEADVDGVHALSTAAFADLDRRQGRSPDLYTPPTPEWYGVRTRHLLASDPEGALAAEVDGEMVGVVMAIVRGDIWGLSLLLVAPGHQSAGIGRQLLDAGLEYGRAARGRLILASDDARAIRAYARSGHRLVPTFDADGPIVRRPPPQDSVREGRWPADRAIADEAGRHVRGAGYGADLAAYLQAGADLFVHEAEPGFVINRDGSPALLAARTPEGASELLRACLHAAPPDAKVSVQFITHANPWAMEVALDAGLVLRPAGPVCVSGDVGPLAPSLLSGAFL